MGLSWICSPRGCETTRTPPWSSPKFSLNMNGVPDRIRGLCPSEDVFTHGRFFRGSDVANHLSRVLPTNPKTIEHPPSSIAGDECLTLTNLSLLVLVSCLTTSSSSSPPPHHHQLSCSRQHWILTYYIDIALRRSNRLVCVCVRNTHQKHGKFIR